MANWGDGLFPYVELADSRTRVLDVMNQTIRGQISMFDHGLLWGVMTVIGPLVLLTALIYAVISYRRRSAASKQQTEQATQELYKRGAQQERREET
jgi:hypothetical protein